LYNKAIIPGWRVSADCHRVFPPQYPAEMSFFGRRMVTIDYIVVDTSLTRCREIYGQWGNCPREEPVIG